MANIQWLCHEVSKEERPNLEDLLPKSFNYRIETFNLIEASEIKNELRLRLAAAGHTGGIGCRCSECQRLKDQEDKWISRLGTFYTPHGLNTRDEIMTRSRVNFSRHSGF